MVTTDFLPTVAEIVGFDLPKGLTLDGISILPILLDSTGERVRGRNINFAFHIKKGQLDSTYNGAVVGDKYKYYAQFKKGKMEKFFLYDLENDIGESKNVSAGNEELTMQMRTELEDFLRSVTASAAEIGCLATHDRRDVNC